ncbi:MAG: hypothetical protein QOE54_3395 [Streptosporangiaceae bacterium]|jgi:hypothetical protein|nr:hypothetical protein [Streptosporangiaceae bacterium]MDX6431029.1 hypothetical protein [Streptosporangiaceae bacterium]
MNDPAGPPDDKGEDPPIQRDPISRSSHVQSEEAVKGDREPTEHEAGTEPESPHGVGESVSAGGEEGGGAEPEGTEGAGRPYGTAEGPESSAPVEPVDEDE